MTATRQRIGRSELLKRGGTLLVAASGVGAFAPAAFADGVPDGDLAYLRLLIASELLAVDFYDRVLGAESLPSRSAGVLTRVSADESEHHTLLAALFPIDAQGGPPTPGEIDISYPPGTFRNPRSILRFAKELEHMLTGAYIDALENVQTPAYREAMARILASEAQHHGAIAELFGEPVIGKPSLPIRMEAMSNFLDTLES